MRKHPKKSSPNTNLTEELFTYLKSVLEINKEEGIIIQGNGFIGEIPNRKGQKFLKFRLEVLKGKPRKGKKGFSKK